MAAEYDDILDDPFHGCALRAYLEVMAETGQWPPDSEATKQRAYRYYEDALAEKNAGVGRVDACPSPPIIRLDRTIQKEDTPMTASPTRTYTSLDAAYDHFNRALFGGTLPPCLMTMQRRKGAYGYFSGERFALLERAEEVTDEIALNPATFARRTPTAILSTLAHEMAHLWQHHHGLPGRRGYHNREWAAKMREIGLIPTDTGQPGGKETGEKVTHIIEAGGRFATACAAYLATDAAILYHDRAGEGDAARKKKAASKTKYTCPGCGVNAWAKPDTKLVCGECEEPMEAEEGGGEGEE